MTNGSTNLTPNRGPSVWDRKTLSPDTDLHERQRWGLALAGSGLSIVGLKGGGWLGGLATSVGGILAIRAVLGFNDYDALEAWATRLWCDRPWRPTDVVEDASQESFPASDAPSWTPTGGTRATGQVTA